MQIITNDKTIHDDLSCLGKESIYINCPQDLKKIERNSKSTLFIKGDNVLKEVIDHVGGDYCFKPQSSINSYMKLEEVENVINSSKPIPIKGLFTLKDFEEGFIEKVLHEPKMGLTVGWDDMDKLFRVRKKELTILTGYPNCGKSQFLDNIMVNLAEMHDWKFGICSFENGKEEHMKYILQKHAKKPAKDIMKTTEDYQKVRGFLNDHFMFIKNEEAGLTIDDIIDISSKAVHRYNLDAIVIDPYNWIEGRNTRISETDYISNMITKVQRFAKQFNIHVFFVAHPTKHETSGRNTRPPLLNDISGGAHWNNKADIGITVHRDRNEDYEYTNYCRVIVSKVRHKESGKTGQCFFEYQHRSGCYTSSCKEVYEEITQTTKKENKWGKKDD